MTLGLEMTWAPIPSGPSISGDLKPPLQQTSPEHLLCPLPSVGFQDAETNPTPPSLHSAGETGASIGAEIQGSVRWVRGC